MLETRSTVNIPLNGLRKNHKPTSSTTENGGYNASDAEKGTVGSNGKNGNADNNVVDIPEAVLEKLFRNYVFKQRRAGSKWFIFATFLCTIWILIIPHQSEMVPNAFLVFSTVTLIMMRVMLDRRVLDRKRFETVHKRLTLHGTLMLWFLFFANILTYYELQTKPSPREVLGWIALFNFLIYITLPMQLFYGGCLLGFASLVMFPLTAFTYGNMRPLFWEQMIASFIMIFTAALIGVLCYFMSEAKQRRAFLEAKKSLEVKMVIEEQSAEQERLLLSVLPKHVAVKMRQDLGSTSSEPFKKIYMSRHENVSILYADIVGFTAISSTYSAQDLVKMLNELFARFDSLSEKYHQLRIKILGDCYYCISGAPDERPDHAVLCVHMGLSMVEAIKYVQQKANSPVDMRVGIHTGAILAGILGQRQWQFDIYSKDVELANKMESSGKAGRVHISDKTLAFLNGAFEVEPAYGERMDEALRIAGLKTYFITNVLKPFSSPVAKRNRECSEIVAGKKTEAEKMAIVEKAVDGGAVRNVRLVKVISPNTNFKVRLQEELIARDGHEDLSSCTNIFLKFKNKGLEAAYAAHREPFSSLPLLATLLVQALDIGYSYAVLPRSQLHLINISAPLIPMAMLIFISIAESFPKYLPESLVSLSKRFNDITFVRELTAIILAMTIGLSNVVDMYFYVTYLKTDHVVLDSEIEPITEGEGIIAPAEPSLASLLANATMADEIHMFPSYMSNYAVLILIAIAVIAQLTHVTKIVLMIVITALHCYCNIFLLGDLYSFEDELAANPTIPTAYRLSAVLILVTLALSFLVRHVDREDRVIFKWKTEVAEQREKATDMRRRNEALVYNILPVHVAEHFMKNTKRSHDDLYSQSYAEVGVLFASMPNFSDFYSEETVNNQGLECLRFLNEVISDFDALLELPQFQDIIKIKTIGSTYMAASGINSNRVSKPDDPITKRWSHLEVLVEFALELKKALQGINEQSFNHFVLKMGINHGPITAGVIGARKPHYDIWGNTVNVASRMESTGKAGAIQVTDETCGILQEFGYTFQQRGLVSVKGKGQLMTFYLQGKTDKRSINKQTIQQATEDPIKQSVENHPQPTSEQCNGHSALEPDIKTPLLDVLAHETNSTADGERDALIN
ncbi:adenylate cyclase type 3 isoform X2 [Bactrocera neohumeralis]|uniref:adenylate cyclase type 3 isoform X2 n=1 Tax=Bactrocera tryoni TaxID=59916 RepID=UPI001A9592C0|nr:adenylate cyclase type 3 isoform X2 [Bactrocera tryoni]XP_050320194.1 adenylate cyclase type 3 isoform X2 [Bactrocera neohumeralis]